ncbi:hypothetical protein ANN_25989 [Periplaneta americana]|uniref:Reverse transcriptase n=1 Tax=Periplaneta americana TaxID=6978 RepID=A0ABQ8S4W8_PERAM|nr:hypothetical protein ANN_25989 [Periplaneta americana]
MVFMLFAEDIRYVMRATSTNFLINRATRREDMVTKIRATRRRGLYVTTVYFCCYWLPIYPIDIIGTWKMANAPIVMAVGNDSNITEGIHRKFLWNVWLPFDPNYLPTFLVGSVCQTFLITTELFIISTTDLFILVIVLVLTLQFNLLGTAIQTARETVITLLQEETGQGKGVILYKEFTPANKWIRQPDRFSSEWRQALKMTANVCPLRAIPGRSRDGNHCRRCVSEIETLGHVLGACTFSETLRNSRHHRIRSMITEALRKKGLTVHEEVHGISQEGSCRRIDMLSIPPGSTSAYIIDPTVRFEAQKQQPADVHAEKCRIYEPTVPFYLEKYHLTSIEVVGLMVGARSTIPRLFVSFCKKFQLNNDFIRDVSLAAIR